MLKIVVDLTPILPGGDNGGAKIMTLQLVKQFSIVAPEHQFILLSSKQNHKELSLLKSNNVEVVNTSALDLTASNIFLMTVGAIIWPIFKLAKLIGLHPFKDKLRNLYLQMRSNLISKNLLKSFKPDLLFCPFTVPIFSQLNIPIIAVIYDLQSFYYPQFFTSTERDEREKNFRLACKQSDKLICISDFVKQTVIDNSNVPAEKIKRIYIRSANRFSRREIPTELGVLNKYQISSNNFLLYPANFWAHKNHEKLFEAIKIYQDQNPESTLKLLCTGVASFRKSQLQDLITTLNLEKWIILPGYLSDKEFDNLIFECKALIFPSLYEGFGMPILEAMAAGKPVLCSNLTSLPEIAASAAILFDPTQPQEIAKAIYRLQHEPDLISHMIKLGYERIKEFGTEIDMAKEYLQVFNDVYGQHEKTLI